MIVAGKFVFPPGASRVGQWLPAFDCAIEIKPWGSGPGILLLDTGAEQTSIMPNLGKTFNIAYDNLIFDQSSGGVGRGMYCEWNAVVSFFDRHGNRKDYDIPVAIFEPTDDNQSHPSLLGRDIIGNYPVDVPNLTVYPQSA